MNKLFIFCIAIFLSEKASAQEVPVIQITSLSGKPVSTSLFNHKSDTVFAISFWATWCVPCINELSAINDKLNEWQSKVKVAFFAISTDDSRTSNRVVPFVNGKNWEFHVLLDKNQEFKRALNVANIPYTILVKNGKIIYRRSGYVSGEEDELFKNIIKANE